MPSESYRVYRLDTAGQLHEPEWFDAESDQNAIATSEQSGPTRDAKFGATGVSSRASRPIACRPGLEASEG